MFLNLFPYSLLLRYFYLSIFFVFYLLTIAYMQKKSYLCRLNDMQRYVIR